MMRPKKALIEKCRRQDYEAFGRFIDAYQNRVYGFIRRMVPSLGEAEDLTQEVSLSEPINTLQILMVAVL